MSTLAMSLKTRYLMLALLFFVVACKAEEALEIDRPDGIGAIPKETALELLGNCALDRQVEAGQLLGDRCVVPGDVWRIVEISHVSYGG